MTLAYLEPNKPDPSSSPSPSTSKPTTPPQPILTQDQLKKIAACKAVEYVQSNMIIGLGTGSTAKHAINRIADLLNQGKLTNITCIPTSSITYQHASSLNIPLSDLDTHPVLDLVIDGADEVDPDMNIVKGRAGSLLRDKMIQSCSNKVIIIVDESKLVEHVGGVPVEVVKFCWKFTAKKLEMLFKEVGCVCKLRVVGEGFEPYVTDNGNYIVDLFFKKSVGDLKEAGDMMMRVVGVVEHGVFVGMATTVIVAGEFGVTVRNKCLTVRNG